MSPLSRHPRRPRLRVLVAGGACVAALALAGGGTPATAAATVTTASCVDGGGITWRTKVIWGDSYTSGGVERTQLDYAGWTTNAAVMATDSTVTTYERSGAAIQRLTKTASTNYRSGTVYDAQDPKNPLAGGAQVTISVGKDNDGKANCTTTHLQPSTGVTEQGFTAFVTGFTYYDNTPPGTAAISHPVVHSRAGGVGTYDDPITLAVGHSFETGRDVLDYPPGTRFYMPYLQRYFIVEDTCGDGDHPEDGPCHVHPKDVTAWLDVWVDGRGGSERSATACAERITGNHTVIRDPRPDYATVPGPLSSGVGCAL